MDAALQAVRRCFEEHQNTLRRIELDLQQQLGAKGHLELVQRTARLQTRLGDFEQRCRLLSAEEESVLQSIDQLMLSNHAALLQLEGSVLPTPAKKETDTFHDRYEALSESLKKQFSVVVLEELYDNIRSLSKGRRKTDEWLSLKTLATKAGSKIAGRTGKEMLRALSSMKLVVQNPKVGVKLCSNTKKQP